VSFKRIKGAAQSKGDIPDCIGKYTGVLIQDGSSVQEQVKPDEII